MAMSGSRAQGFGAAGRSWTWSGVFQCGLLPFIGRKSYSGEEAGGSHFRHGVRTSSTSSLSQSNMNGLYAVMDEQAGAPFCILISGGEVVRPRL